MEIIEGTLHNGQCQPFLPLGIDISLFEPFPAQLQGEIDRHLLVYHRRFSCLELELQKFSNMDREVA